MTGLFIENVAIVEHPFQDPRRKFGRDLRVNDVGATVGVVEEELLWLTYVYVLSSIRFNIGLSLPD